MPYKLGETAQWLQENYDKYDTLKACAQARGVSTMRISQLCKKLNITKWRAKPRKPETAAKFKIAVCDQC